MTPTLRPYQQHGVDWLAARPFGLLADGVGLGKTCQYVLAAERVVQRDLLLVAPAATIPGLSVEVLRWWPQAHVVVVPHRGPVPASEGRRRVVLVPWTSLATAEGAIRRAVLEGRLSPDVLVADESHRTGGPDSQMTAAFLRVSELAGRVWCVTATPASRPRQLWATLRAGLPKAVRDQDLRWLGYRVFAARYCLRRQGMGYDDLGASNIPDLEAKLRPHLLRRTAADVPGELPDLQTVVVPLGAVGCEVHLPGGRVLDPRLLAGVIEAGDLPPPDEQSAYRAALGAAKVAPVTAWAQSWLDGHPDDALVVFAHHRQIVEDLAQALGGWAAHGGHSAIERQSRIDAWRDPKAPRVMVASLDACGTGLNGLHQRTTHVAVAELPWDPTALVQALGRVRRKGSVAGLATAHLLVADDPVEGVVLQVLARKAGVAAGLGLGL